MGYGSWVVSLWPGGAAFNLLRFGNGPEQLADRFVIWCAERGVELQNIELCKPDQAAFIERFSRISHTEILHVDVVESLIS